MGHDIGRDNYIRKGKLQDWTVTAEAASGADADLKEKGEKKDMSGRVISIQHVTLNEMAQPVNLCVSIRKKR